MLWPIVEELLEVAVDIAESVLTAKESNVVPGEEDLLQGVEGLIKRLVEPPEESTLVEDIEQVIDLLKILSKLSLE